jgi:DNA-binding IclR family transcriptional regulator
MEQGSTTTSDVQVLDRAVAVLHALEAGPASLAELVAATSLPRATTHRLATALEHHGLVSRDAQGRFVLGPTLGRLGAASAGAPSLAALAVPALEVLRDTTGESVQLYVRRGDERVCVVSLESPHSLRTIVRVGAVMALPLGSAGRVLSGEAAGSGGWVESVEEREAGVASVSAAVFDRRRATGARVAAAVSVSGPIERVSRQPGLRYGEAVVRSAAAVEHAAGLSGAGGPAMRATPDR